MAKQTFTAGQVLTAAEMNSLQENDYNWTVTTKTASYTLAAGDEGTRIVMNNAGATTITVDDAVFAAGDVVWIHNIGAGTCTVTAGTATVNSAASLDLAQWEGGSLFFTSASSAIFFRGGGGVDAFSIEYVVVAGGGAGGTGNSTNAAGGGGAGGYVSNVSGENSGGASTPNPALYIPRGEAVYVSIGAGGTGATGGDQQAPNWTSGTTSYFGDVWAIGGGRGGGITSGNYWHYPMPNGTSGSNGGQGEIGGPVNGIARQGSNGGAFASNGGGGGGGSAANGSNGTVNNGGAGGAGTASSITGSSVTRAGGGGGGGTSSGGAGGTGGGGAGSTGTGASGTANTGGGGGAGGGASGVNEGGSGGSGVIILKWLTADATPTIGAGLTTSSATSGDYTVLTITAGTDTITWN